MSLKDIFKKKEEEKTESKDNGDAGSSSISIKKATKEISKDFSQAAKKKPVLKKEESKTEEKKIVEKKKTSKEIRPEFLKVYHPHITEKASDLKEMGHYVFQIDTTANKTEIAKAIEKFYGVKVEKIRILNVRRKRKRLGKSQGFSKSKKKAIVVLRKGQEIDIIAQ